MHSGKKTTAGLTFVATVIVVAIAMAGLPSGAAGQAPGFTVPGRGFGRATPGSQVLVAGPWGSAAGQFGKSSNSRYGPASFAVDPQENVYVLDGLNGRVQRFDGNGIYLSSFTVPETSEEIALADDGSIYVMDPYGQHKILRYRQDGSLLHEYPIAPDIDLITPGGLFVNGSDLLVESLGPQNDPAAKTYRVATGGQPLPFHDQVLPVATKKPTRSAGLNASATVLNRQTIEVAFQRAGGPEGKVRLSLQRLLASLVELDADRAGVLYVGFISVLRDPAPRDKPPTQLTVVAFTQQGQYVGRAEMPGDYVTDPFRYALVSEGGRLYQMQTTPDGVRIVRWPLEK